MCDGVPDLIDHILYKTGGQVTQRRPYSAKCHQHHAIIP